MTGKRDNFKYKNKSAIDYFVQDKIKWKNEPKEQVFDYFVQDKWKKGPKEQVFVDSRQ